MHTTQVFLDTLYSPFTHTHTDTHTHTHAENLGVNAAPHNGNNHIHYTQNKAEVVQLYTGVTEVLD